MRKILKDLYTTEYEHPFDRQALDRLENTRGLSLLTNKILDYGFERFLRIKHTGDNIRVNKENLPEIYPLLEEACSILEVNTVPELYLHQEDKIQSFTSGEKRQIVVLSSGAVELLEEQEMLFLLGREIGHIKSRHVLYHMMADSVQVISQIIGDMSLGIGTLLSMPIRIALLHWHRMAAFTADRAGLLACQEPEVAYKALIKMAGLPQKYSNRITVEDLREQAHEFDNVKEQTFEKIIRFAAAYDSYTPLTIIRASQMFQWVDGGHFNRILQRESLKDFQFRSSSSVDMSCPQCQFKYEDDDDYCRMCGSKLKVAS